MTYAEDDMLMLSGIQHFVVCPRQWALIHIEQQWKENVSTVEGQILHQRVDDPTQRMLNSDTITLRAVHIASKRLGLYGISDAIELHHTEDEQNSITHHRYKGRFIPHPVEYKRGHQKVNDCDIMQLVAQVMCLEEMYDVKIPSASLFYWEVRRREEIEITDELRSDAEHYAEEMHRIYSERFTPLASFGPKCRKCSLHDICMPDMKNNVNNYLKQLME